MYYSIIEAKYLNGYKLHLIFEDGKSGDIDLVNYTKGKEYSSVFQISNILNNFLLIKNSVFFHGQMD